MQTLRLPNHLQKLIICFFSCIFLCYPASAQTPTFAYDPSSPSADTIPLGSAVYNSAQYLFAPGDFAPSTPGTGGVISTIYVKAGNTESAGSTFTDLNVYIGPTTQANLSAGTWVFSLGLAYSNTTAAVASWTTNDWIAITLQTPFIWDGTSNFIVGIFQNGYTHPLELQHSAQSGRTARAYGNSGNGGPSGADNSLMHFGFDLTCNGTPSAPTITSAAFAAATPLCSGNTTVINASFPSTPVVAGISYQWESAASSTGPWSAVSGGSGATTLNYTTDAITANTYFRVGATCITSNITSYSNEYLVPVGSSQPGAITGAGFCPGDPETYSVPNVSGASYTWTLPSGWSGTSTSNSILVTAGSNPGVISVTATSSCGPVSIAQTFTPVPGNAPGTPGSISGNTHVCPGTTQTYSTFPINGATSYLWTLPAGWSGTSNTNSITVTTDNNPGNISVQAVNGCGQSTSSAPLAVNIITALANPGTIIGEDTVCSGGIQSYSINPVAGATAYNWTLPSGWSGTTTGSTIQTFPGTSGGTITVTASTTCATSTTSTLSTTAITTVTPSVTVAAPTGAFCDLTAVTFTATPVYGGATPIYQWLKNGLNVSGVGNTYTDSRLSSTDLISVTLTSNEVCVSNSTTSSSPVSVTVIPSVTPGISINTVPPINICQGTPVTFTTVSIGGGGTPTYQWFKNGALIPTATGTNYIDATLKDGDVITIEMTTSAECPTMPVATSNLVGVHVIAPVTPTVSVSVSPSNIYVPGQWLTFTATHTNGGATPDYQWQKNGVDIAFENGDTYTSNNLQIGDNISVKMLSYEDCVTSALVKSNVIQLNAALNVGGEHQQTASEISVYPNPNAGRFTVAATSWDAAFSGRQVRVDVLSALGQSVYHMELIPSAAKWQTQVNLGNELANGRYMLRVSTADGAFKTTLPFLLNR